MMKLGNQMKNLSNHFLNENLANNMNNDFKKNFIVGLFTIVGIGLFTFIIFYIGSNENLFTRTIKVITYFENVSGLKSGTNVTYSGIDVGSVTDINIVEGNKIEVIMRVESKVKKYIKTDSRVSIVSEGLVGSKVIDISAGSPGLHEIENGAVLASIKPLTAEDIMKSLKETGDNATLITKDLADITNRINKGEGTVGQLLTNDSLYESINNVLQSFGTHSKDLNEIFANLGIAISGISNDFDKLTKELNSTVKDLSSITSKLNSNESFIGTLLTDTLFSNNLKETIESARNTAKNLEGGSFSFNQNMEALKHNFFFKGYFEDMGYWDKEKFEVEYDNRMQKLKESQIKLDSLNNLINNYEKKLKEK